jgi:putative oxidoreductase
VKLGRLLLRATVGGFFIGHGTQKLFGWFGGHGLDATGQMFENLGLRPGRRNAIAAGAAEAGGGALLAAGLATPVGAAVITATMLTAIHRVHLKNGPWASNGGYEYNAVLIAAALTLAEIGPGKPSLDDALGLKLSGPAWATAAALGGVAGAVGARVAASSQAAPESAPAPAVDETNSQPSQEPVTAQAPAE